MVTKFIETKGIKRCTMGMSGYSVLCKVCDSYNERGYESPQGTRLLITPKRHKKKKNQVFSTNIRY